MPNRDGNTTCRNVRKPYAGHLCEWVQTAEGRISGTLNGGPMKGLRVSTSRALMIDLNNGLLVTENSIYTLCSGGPHLVTSAEMMRLDGPDAIREELPEMVQCCC